MAGPPNDETVEPLFVALTLVGLIMGAMLAHAGAPTTLVLGVHLATYFFGGFYAVRTIIAATLERTIEVDLLMVLAALGAAYLGAWTEGATLLFLFSLSNVLQNYAMSRTHEAISALLELRPDTVELRRAGQLVTTHLDEVQVGDVFVLRPGDRVALDGIILSGTGNFDESSLTGESLPVQKQASQPVLAGTLNQTGALEVQVTKLAADSTLSRIIGMVSEAQASKAHTQSVLDRYEKYYAMGVIGTVLLFILLLPVLFQVDFADNFYRGMVLLTVASPCALVISVPAALLSAIAGAARGGVLFKGGAYLEAMSKVQVIAFDKTGTLTYGKPQVTDVVPASGISERELLDVLARAEQNSEHPLAHAILSYTAAQGIRAAAPDSFTAVTGMGVRATWDGVETLVGSPRLMHTAGIRVAPQVQAEYERLLHAGRGTVLLVYRGEQWLGLVSVMDRERPDAAERIADLRALGIQRIVMLTGDNRPVAEAMAQRLGIDEVHAELMPADKLRLVRELEQQYGHVAMVGDGVNDAPALAAAHVGIAMGAAGTDVALETADIVLMRDDLGAMVQAVRLSKRAQRIVWQNIIFALAVVVVLVTLTLTIGIPLPLGVLGHEGSTILVVLNGLRLLLPSS
ncbi:MAG: cadmium-translocating P-type ATPase [Chloroflexaceae bacterium]|nr:cadmium-translocating P-type ATPase [Chloroflexaceae bacterium]